MNKIPLFVQLLVLLLIRPYVSIFDIFAAFLVLKLLQTDVEQSTLVNTSLTVALVYTFLADMTLGAFPLVLGVSLLLFMYLFRIATPKGATALALWSTFAMFFILFDSGLKQFLLTSSLSFGADILWKILATIGVIVVGSFLLSFKRKL